MGEDWLDLNTVADVSFDLTDDLDSERKIGDGRASVVTEFELLSM